MANKCLDCNAELEQHQPCPKCGNTNVLVQLAGAGISRASAWATVTVTQHWTRLLDTSEKLFNQKHYGAAVIVAATACEVLVERTVQTALEKKKIPELVDPIDGLIFNYNLKRKEIRKLYETLTGDQPAGGEDNKPPAQKWWQPFCRLVEDRNKSVHEGKDIDAAHARNGIDAAKELVEHISRHNGWA